MLDVAVDARVRIDDTVRTLLISRAEEAHCSPTGSSTTQRLQRMRCKRPR
jgi:hypothetical protein